MKELKEVLFRHGLVLENLSSISPLSVTDTNIEKGSYYIRLFRNIREFIYTHGYDSGLILLLSEEVTIDEAIRRLDTIILGNLIENNLLTK